MLVTGGPDRGTRRCPSVCPNAWNIGLCFKSGPDLVLGLDGEK
jgi:hypothetical protein